MIKLMVVGSSPWPEDKYVPFDHTHTKTEDGDGMIAEALTHEQPSEQNKKTGGIIEP